MCTHTSSFPIHFHVFSFSSRCYFILFVFLYCRSSFCTAPFICFCRAIVATNNLFLPTSFLTHHVCFPSSDTAYCSWARIDTHNRIQIKRCIEYRIEYANREHAVPTILVMSTLTMIIALTSSSNQTNVHLRIAALSSRAIHVVQSQYIRLS